MPQSSDAFYAVLAHAQNDSVRVFERGLMISKGNGLFGAARRGVFRVEVNNDNLAPVVSKVEVRALIGRQGKVGAAVFASIVFSYSEFLV